MFKKFSAIVLLGLYVTVCTAVDIYKYTDAEGNVYYSDKKLLENETEAEINSITVIESSELDPKSTWKRIEHKRKQAASLFDDFVITTPQPHKTLLVTDGNMLARVNLESKLEPRFRIKFYLDDLPHGKVKSSTQLISDIEEGDHKIYAEIIEAVSRKVIKTTPTIFFTLKNREIKEE